VLHQIIDRRLAGKNKSIANRERFLRRVKGYIRRAVSEAVSDRSIKDIQNTQSITIPRKDIAEPSFRHGPGGKREMVHPGNADYIRGDKIPRPQGGGGNPNYGPMGGPQYGGGNYGGPGYTGNWDPRNQPGVVQPQQLQSTYNDTLRSLQQLQQQAVGTDPNMARDLQNMIREMQRLNPYTYGNDPLLSERINQALIGNVQQIEMELRRKVEEANGTGSVRSPGNEKVPAGYADKVADYYRKLSEGNKPKGK